MSFSIRAETDAGVVEPEGRYTFEMIVRDDRGRPAAGQTLNLSLGPNRAVTLVDGVGTTDEEGRAPITLEAGDVAEAVSLTVTVGEARWQGTLCVTDVHLLARGIDLTRVDEALLLMLFRDKDELRILREFGGGLSGSRVLQVQAFDAAGAFLTQVVKLGIRDEIRHEGANYDLFRDRLSNAAPVAGSVEAGSRAAIIYGDAHAARSLEPVMSLARYFDEHDADDLHAALYAVLEVGLRKVYCRYHVEARTYGQLLGTFLPENVVVGLDGGIGPFGVYRPGHTPALPEGTLRLRPLDVERGAARRSDLKKGDVVLLKGFRISKVQEDDLNLEDEARKRYKVKVRYEGAGAVGLATGEQADVVARVITDRDTRMEFAVRDCLLKQGLERHERGFSVESDVFPDPLGLLPALLDRSCDVAWGTIHGDLHWDNVLLEGPSNWWLIDYGLTGKGPILFDFVKLELYLRRTQLSKIPDLAPEQILAFEQDLVNNPMGRLPSTAYEHAELNKAAAAIRTIRRLAQRYFMDDYFEYLRLLFVYALALTKYYPTQDKWDAARGDEVRLEALRKSGWQLFFGLAPALAVGRVLLWDRVREKGPTLNHDFVPVGARLEPRPGTVVLDVGNRLEPGVIDHHHLKEGEPACTTSLVWKHPGLVADHIAATDPDSVQWIVHEWPDFDGVAATYLAWYRAKLGFFPPGAEALQRYAFEVDAGAGFLEIVPFPGRTPYALFGLYLHTIDLTDTSKQADARRMRCGFEVMDYLCRHEAMGTHVLADNLVPHEHGFRKATMGRDRRTYERLDRPLAREIEAAVRHDGRTETVKGLVLKSPRSLFFKAWARSSGCPLLVVLWLQPDKPDDQIIVSVPPAFTFALQGLGKALEAAEHQKRAELGKPRPDEAPRWDDADNNDPWYDGRSPAHCYTIVAAPRMGTVLTVEEVVAVLQRGDWMVSEPIQE